MAVMPTGGYKPTMKRKKKSETESEEAEASEESASEGTPRGVGGSYIMKDGVRVPRDED